MSKLGRWLFGELIAGLRSEEFRIGAGNVATLTGRELSAQFFSPIAYVVIAVFLVVSGIFFGAETFQPGGEASCRALFQVLPIILVFVLPMLTMRLMSEEYRNGTIESLMTAPVRDLEVILGKFLGSFIFFLVLLGSTLIYPLLVSVWGPLDMGLAFSSYVGLALMGALYIAVGLFFSTCTRNQVIAVLCSFVLLAILTLLADYLARSFEGTLRVVLQQVSLLAHYQDFARGLIDTNHTLFFVTSTALFLFFAVKVLEFRRWR